VLPRARGEADRMNEEAKAYQEQVVNVARGEVQSFLAVYETYRQAKDVTAWRMYLDSMDQLLRKSGKVIIDSSGHGVAGLVPYMPIAEGRDKSAASSAAGSAAASTPPAAPGGVQR
jgi:membrane protease subunit HflK